MAQRYAQGCRYRLRHTDSFFHSESGFIHSVPMKHNVLTEGILWLLAYARRYAKDCVLTLWGKAPGSSRKEQVPKVGKAQGAGQVFAACQAQSPSKNPNKCRLIAGSWGKDGKPKATTKLTGGHCAEPSLARKNKFLAGAFWATACNGTTPIRIKVAKPALSVQNNKRKPKNNSTSCQMLVQLSQTKTEPEMGLCQDGGIPNWLASLWRSTKPNPNRLRVPDLHKNTKLDKWTCLTGEPRFSKWNLRSPSVRRCLPASHQDSGLKGTPQIGKGPVPRIPLGPSKVARKTRCLPNRMVETKPVRMGKPLPGPNPEGPFPPRRGIAQTPLPLGMRTKPRWRTSLVISR